MSISDLQNHCDIYELKDTDEGYEFVSVNGISYFITFSLYPSFVGVDLECYVFNIESSKSRPPYDAKVKRTIIYVLKKFFERNEDALITTYDIADQRQHKRKILFDRWFNDGNPGNIEKLEFALNDTYLCMYISVDNPLKGFHNENILNIVEILKDN